MATEEKTHTLFKSGDVTGSTFNHTSTQVTQYTFLLMVSHYSTDLQIAVMHPRGRKRPVKAILT